MHLHAAVHGRLRQHVVHWDDLSADDMPYEYCHYTGLQTLYKLLPLAEELPPHAVRPKALWLSPPHGMNDPEEGKSFLTLIQNNYELRSLLPKDITTYCQDDYENCVPIFTLCFARLTDNLTLWRLYGDDGCGASVTLPAPELKRCLPNPTDGYHTCVIISYDNAEVTNAIRQIAGPLCKLSDALDDVAISSGAKREIKTSARSWVAVLRLCYKDFAYSDEKELRVLAYPDTAHENSVRHVLDGKKVIFDGIVNLFDETLSIPGTITLGPSVDSAETRRLSLQRRLKFNGFTTWRVSTSSSKYRSAIRRSS
jgi:hypothetical protein